MQLARCWQPGCTLHMDLSESLFGPEAGGGAQAERLLRDRAQARGGLALEELLVGAASPALNAALLRAGGLSSRAGMPAGPQDLAALARAISDFHVAVTGTRGFDAAQVTAGGVETAAFDPHTLQSRLCPGLYAAGEILDVDGACGGFNLMFAFASGLIAGGPN